MLRQLSSNNEGKGLAWADVGSRTEEKNKTGCVCEGGGLRKM